MRSDAPPKLMNYEFYECGINDDLDQDLLFKLLECFACSRGKFPHDLQLLVEIYCELWNTQIKSIKVIPKLRELVNDVGCGRQIVYWGQKGKNENSAFAYWCIGLRVNGHFSLNRSPQEGIFQSWYFSLHLRLGTNKK